MLRSLQERLGLLFLAFALLVLVSVGAMFWGLETQKQDALLINLAGRQRMLIQQMARLTEEWNAARTDGTLTALREAESTFELTLTALREGGEVPYLSGQIVLVRQTHTPELLARLSDLNDDWIKFHAALENAILIPSAGTLQTMQEESAGLLHHADEVVNEYQLASEARMALLRTIQIGFLIGALILLGLGAWTTRRSALQPLRQLVTAANRLGENDLETAIQVEGPDEIQTLSQAFEAMRVRLHSSRAELVALNESLEERVLQRTHELETLNEVSSEISSRLDIQQVLNSVTEKARTLLGGEVASLCLMDENQHWMKLQAISGPQNAVGGQAVRADKELAQAVLKGDQALICGLGSCQGGCSMLSEPYRASHMAAPLRVGERVIGALCVGSLTQSRFANESANMLTKLANAAAIALENARLYVQAEHVATLEERHRMAAEMHDGLGQTLSYLGLMTDQVVDFLSTGQDAAAIERLHKTRETIGKATSEVRNAINSLMDETPSPLDLCTRLSAVVDEFASDYGLSVTWQPEAAAPPDCSRQVSEQILNITREALNNVVRHAQARQVAVQMGQRDGHYQITIKDDGKGFDTSQPEPDEHFGLRIMQVRAGHIGGQVSIDSKPGSGTSVTLVWPEAEEQK